MGRTAMEKAKKEKNDEFYTLYEDIEKELSHYKPYFKGKKVYLPCDNPEISNFYKFFVDHFADYGIKELVCTWLGGNEFYKVTMHDGKLFNEYGYGFNSGDFMENDHFFKRADVIVTNPPFSLFRQFIDIIMKHKKDFLVVGPINAVGYKSVFGYIQKKVVDIGYTRLKYFFNNNVGKFGYGKVIPLNTMVWFTTLPVKKKPVVYSGKGVWQMYDTHNAIEVNRSADMPRDYYGFIGVPVSALMWDLSDFDIIGIAEPYSFGNTVINGKNTYKRVFIRRKRQFLEDS